MNFLNAFVYDHFDDEPRRMSQARTASAAGKGDGADDDLENRSPSPKPGRSYHKVFPVRPTKGGLEELDCDDNIIEHDGQRSELSEHGLRFITVTL